MTKKQKINCDVKSCEYNDTNCDECTLKSIKVSCDNNNDNPEVKSETICNSFAPTKEKE